MKPSTPLFGLKNICMLGAQGSRRKGLFQGLNFWVEDPGRDRLEGRVLEVGDPGEVGEVGEPGGIGAFLGDAYNVSTKGGVGGSIVRIEAPSSSSIPDNVVRSEYEVSRDGVDKRIVSASELELIVDIVRSDAILDALSESECDDVAARPTSYLWAPQWISGMEVWLKRISKTLSRTSRAVSRTTGALLSMLRIRFSK